MNSKYSSIPMVELTLFISTREHKRKAAVSAAHHRYNQSGQILDKEQTSRQSSRLTTNSVVGDDIPRLPHWSLAPSKRSSQKNSERAGVLFPAQNIEACTAAGRSESGLHIPRTSSLRKFYRRTFILYFPQFAGFVQH